MRQIKFKELSLEAFQLYGSFANMLEPDGYCFEGPVSRFYRDCAQQYLGTGGQASFSLCQIWERPLVIDGGEYHNYCEEAILPLDGDILMYVGPATASEFPPLDEIEVFRVPKGTLIVVNPGVWHFLPFPFQCQKVNILCILPERTYMNDCYVKELEGDDRLEIVLD